MSAIPAPVEPAADGGLNAAYVFRLYIAGHSGNSVRAVSNLYALCRKYFPSSHRIEIVDIMIRPLVALTEGILVTPTLIKVSPLPEQQIIGDLSEEDEVLLALGLPRKENG